MSCWWRKIAEAQGLVNAATLNSLTGRGSWKRIVVLGLGVPAGTSIRGSWARIIALEGHRQQTTGQSWTRQLNEIHTGEQDEFQSWARHLAEDGGPF